MAKHEELTEPVAIHPAAFVGVTDPALDPDNNVAANKFWVDTTSGPPFVLKKRNTLNTLWEEVGGGGVATGPIGPPGFGQDGDEGADGFPGLPGPAGTPGTGLAEDGWVAAGETWTYASADSPTFTFTIAGVDRTTKYTIGTRLKLTQSTGGTKYFIVTNVAFSTDTTVTIYGGTDYTLNNEAISSPYFSRMKGPAGLNLDPAKWTVTVISDSASRSQASPTNATWYNLGTLTGNIPIGVWEVNYFVAFGYFSATGDDQVNGFTTLSTANNSESDSSMTGRDLSGGQITAGGNVINRICSITRRRTLTLTSKTAYFLNAKGQSDCASIAFRGDEVPTVVRAICALL